MSDTETKPSSQTSPPQQPEPFPAELEALFDEPHLEPLDAKTLERVLTALLDLYPEASVSAMGEDTLLVEMPDSVPLRRNVASAGRSSVDKIVFSTEVLAAWERMQAEGVARCSVHPVGRPEVTGMTYMLDLRERHGILFTLTVFDQADIAGSADGRPEIPEVTRLATIHKDARSVIVRVDEAITKILGWSAEELEGHRTIEFIHPDDHALAIDNWMEMLARPGPGRRVRLRHRHRDGSWVWFEITNHNLLDDPEHAGVVSEIVDISEEMAAQEELRASKQLMDQLAATVPVGLLQFDAERRVVYTNDRLHRILGVQRAETLEEQLGAVTEEDRSTLEGALVETLAEGRETDIEVRLYLSPRGLLRFCSLSIRALSLEDGTITGAIACVADVTDSARTREELQKRASFDELTRCYNRGSIMLALEASIGSGDRGAERGVIFIDVDRFKSVNDQHGHAAGDEVLRAIARLLQEALRETDILGRVGGDEFLVVCPDIGGPGETMKLAERLAAAALDGEISVATGVIVPKLSIGVAWSSGDSVDAETIVARADSAMYESKRERAGTPKLAPDTSSSVATHRA